MAIVQAADRVDFTSLRAGNEIDVAAIRHRRTPRGLK
jgi:hypothetical protein